jgi:hypothetical protein
LDEAVTNLETHLGWTRAEARAACGSRVARFLGFKAGGTGADRRRAA